MKLIIIIFLIIIYSAAPAAEKPRQPDSAFIAKQKLYFSVVEALDEPDKAYRLCLGGQQLSELPGNIGNLFNLYEVNISQNNLEYLPDSFCELKSLGDLKIPANNLKKLPECFSGLQNLKSLDLSTNPRLAGSDYLIIISKLSSLESLDLSYNNIEHFPKEIFSLKKLKEFILTGNSLSKDEIDNLKKQFPSTQLVF
jgi:Leucine-rich repeat (LRR) protein